MSPKITEGAQGKRRRKPKAAHSLEGKLLPQTIQRIAARYHLHQDTLKNIIAGFREIIRPEVYRYTIKRDEEFVEDIAARTAQLIGYYDYWKEDHQKYDKNARIPCRLSPGIFCSSPFFQKKFGPAPKRMWQQAHRRLAEGIETLVEIALNERPELQQDWETYRLEEISGILPPTAINSIQQNLSTLLKDDVLPSSRKPHNYWVRMIAQLAANTVGYYEFSQQEGIAWSPGSLIRDVHYQSRYGNKVNTDYSTAVRYLRHGFNDIIELAAQINPKVKLDWVYTEHFSVEEHIVKLKNELQNPCTVASVRESIHRYGFNRFRSIADSEIALSLLLVPELGYGYVHLLRDTAASEQVLPDFVGSKRASTLALVHNAFRRKNELKLARDEKGNYISESDYFRFVQQVFNDTQTLANAGYGLAGYMARGNFKDVSVLEEVVDPSSRNPNFRLRMFLATNPELKSTATLDAFVKFYSNAEERNFEAALNNYLYEVAQVPCVGKARSAHLGLKVLVQQEESGEYTYTLSRAEAIADRKKPGCGYALITPFVNLRNLEDEVKEAKDIFPGVTAALVELHTKGIAGLSRISELNQEQREVLEQHLQPIDYEQQSARVMQHEGNLHQRVNALGIMDILNRSVALYPSFIHGDLHPRNIGLKKNDEVVLVDFEPEYSGIGAPQIDLAKLYSYKSMKVSMREQVSLVHDYMQRRQITDENFLFGFHAAAVWNTFVHMRYVVENAGAKYTAREAASSLAQDTALVQQHAAHLYGRTAALQLAELAQQEFRI